MADASVVLTIFLKDGSDSAGRNAVLSSAGLSQFERFNYDQSRTLQCGTSEFTDGLSCVQFLEPVEQVSIDELHDELKTLEEQLVKSLGRELIGISRHWFVDGASMESFGALIKAKAQGTLIEHNLCGVKCLISHASFGENVSHSSCTSIVVTDPNKSTTAELELLLQDINTPLFLRDLLFHKINWIHGPRPQSQELETKHFVDEIITAFAQATSQFRKGDAGNVQLRFLWPKAFEIHSRLCALRLAGGMLPLVLDQIQTVQAIQIPLEEVGFVTSNDPGLADLFQSLEKHYQEVSVSAEKCTNLITPLLEAENVFRSYASYRYEQNLQEASDANAKRMRTLEGIIAAVSVGIGVAALLPEKSLKAAAGLDSPIVDFDVRLLVSLACAVIAFIFIKFYHRRGTSQ